MIVLFVIGEPGIGKTTAIRAMVPMLAADSPIAPHEIEKPKWTIASSVALAGHYRGATFDGADTIPYTGARAALDYWAANLQDVKLTILDGDRFSTQPSLDYVRASGALVLGAYLHASDPDVAEARRVWRGSNQDPTWLKGRVTKARNFAEKVGAQMIDATRSSASVANEVIDLVTRHL